MNYFKFLVFFKEMTFKSGTFKNRVIYFIIVNKKNFHSNLFVKILPCLK